jgi:AhpD family alkylhydroperoxidase
MRASQINGCAYGLHVHSKDARHGGKTEQRLYLLDAWHESSSTPSALRWALPVGCRLRLRQGLDCRPQLIDQRPTVANEQGLA